MWHLENKIIDWIFEMDGPSKKLKIKKTKRETDDVT